MSYGNREYMGEKGQWEIAVVDSDEIGKLKISFQRLPMTLSDG